MPTEVTRLPHIDPASLNCAEHRAAMQRATAITPPMHANQTHRRARLRGKRVEVEIEEIFVSIQLELRRLLSISCRRNDHEQRSLPGAPWTPDELQARTRRFKPLLQPGSYGFGQRLRLKRIRGPKVSHFQQEPTINRLDCRARKRLSGFERRNRALGRSHR